MPEYQPVVRLLGAADSHDAGLVDRLTRLINDVYATAENGLWRDGAIRTTAAELAREMREREIAVATRDGDIVGSVRVLNASAPWAESETIGRVSGVVGHMGSRTIGSGERPRWRGAAGAVDSG